MPDPDYKIGDVVHPAGGGRDKRGVVCGVVTKDFTGGPKRYRVAWDCVPPCPPELDPTGVWCRKYAADELTKVKPKGE